MVAVNAFVIDYKYNRKHEHFSSLSTMLACSLKGADESIDGPQFEWSGRASFPMLLF